MIWSITMLSVNLAVLLALVSLIRGAPRSFPHYIVLGLLIAAETIFVGYYGVEAFGWRLPWQVKSIAYQVVHIAALLWVLRNFVHEQERRCLPKSSVPSQPSLG